ncbi:MAG: DUF6049 family protein [Actinomycetota bacterium]
MRRLLGSLVVVVLLVLGAPPAPAATAPDVSLHLLRLAPWITPTATNLRLQVAATNTGTRPAGNLSFGITVFTPSRSRNQYDESLHTDPPDSGVRFANFDLVPGKLEPGERRVLGLSKSILDALGSALAQGDEHAIYPMKIELRSGDTTLATIRTPIVFLNFPKGQRFAVERLRMAWIFSLHRPIEYGPLGTFLGTGLQSDVAPGGSLAREAAALDDLANAPHPLPVDVVWSPTLLSQLQAMSDGYSIESDGKTERVAAAQGGAADAAAVMDTLHRLANGPKVESTALPFAVPSIPALLAAGLQSDLPVQLQRGRQAVSAFTGHPTDDQLFWPPGGYLDQLSISTLAAGGTTTFLVDPGLVHRPLVPPNEYAPNAPAALESSLNSTVDAVVPDSGVERILGSAIPRADPRLAVQDVLGELAQIWLEQPAIPRAVALAVPDTLRLPGPLFGYLGRILGDAPFLQPKLVSSIVRNFRPRAGPVADLLPREGPRFRTGYVHAIEETRGDISLYRSILVGESTVPAQMENTVLLAEGEEFAADRHSGLAFLDDIRGRLRALFRGIAPDTDRTVTLASGRGAVPIVIENATSTPVRVRIQLASVRLNPSESKSKTVRLLARSTTPLSFQVRSRTTGRFPVQVQVLTPDGRHLGPAHELVVRSTAYNLVALILVLGAALFLLVWWARRFVPRAKPA